MIPNNFPQISRSSNGSNVTRFIAQILYNCNHNTLNSPNQILIYRWKTQPRGLGQCLLFPNPAIFPLIQPQWRVLSLLINTTINHQVDSPITEQNKFIKYVYKYISVMANQDMNKCALASERAWVRSYKLWPNIQNVDLLPMVKTVKFAGAVRFISIYF